MTQTIDTSFKLHDVTKIHRYRRGDIYRAEITLEELFNAIRNSRILYSPRYQRGLKNWSEATDDDLAVLLPLTHPSVQIKKERAEMMAVKYLEGRLYSSHITWNARMEPGVPVPDFDDEQQELAVYSAITVPDTGHRHRAYYLLVLWKKNPDEIPDQVEVDGSNVSREEIVELLQDFDPEQDSVFCEIHTLTAREEGYLYDEFNADAKPPAGAVAIDLNPTKTPSRRFIYALMESTPVFARDEVETRGNTIGSKSRKLTTNSTLEAAARSMAKSAQALSELESDADAYNDLLEFFAAFFEEYAHAFPEFQPGTSGTERHALRGRSFALSNIMFHPLFKLAYEIWAGFREKGQDWRSSKKWRDGVTQLGGKIKTKDPDTGKSVTVEVMSRDNPDWRGKILVPSFDEDGNRIGFVLSSTRQTREAAYAYLRAQAGL